VVDPVEIKRHRQTGQVRASSEPAPWRILAAWRRTRTRTRTMRRRKRRGRKDPLSRQDRWDARMEGCTPLGSPSCFQPGFNPVLINLPHSKRWVHTHGATHFKEELSPSHPSCFPILLFLNCDLTLSDTYLRALEGYHLIENHLSIRRVSLHRLRIRSHPRFLSIQHRAIQNKVPLSHELHCLI